MSNLIKAFEQMVERGLIAQPYALCPCCAPKEILREARQWQNQNRLIRGFVHLGETEPALSIEDLRTPVVFGTLQDTKLVHGSPSVGEMVVECLEGQGIRYEWDRVPGKPMFIRVDPSMKDFYRQVNYPIPVGEGYELFTSGPFPGRAFDQVKRNPVRLLNLERVRQLGLDAPHMRGAVWHPRLGEKVKLGFCVWDAVAPEAQKKCGDDIIGRVQLECMWVEVTSHRRKGQRYLYRGELMSVPVWIDPDVLRIGSPVSFSAAHIYPARQSRPANTLNGPDARPTTKR